jgi:hypothetical protein
LKRQDASPARTVFCPQDHIEPVLLDAVRAQPSVGVRLGTEVSTLDLCGDSFVLLTGEGGDGRLRGARRAAAERRMPLAGAQPRR